MKLPFLSLMLALFFINVNGQSVDDFYNIDSIQNIDVKFSSDDWSTDLDSLYLNSDDYLFCDVTINGELYAFSGIRYSKRLSNSTKSLKSSLEIKLNMIDKAQNYSGYHELVLSQALRDPSLVREVIYYEMARKFMHASKANYAQVTMGDLDYGLMINVEAVNKDFVESRFGEKEGTLIASNLSGSGDSKEMDKNCLKKVHASLQVEKSPLCYFNDFDMISDGGWGDLMKLTSVLGNKEASLSSIEKALDVDQTLWYLALNNLTVNLKSYLGKESGNYYLYQKENGQFVILPWGTNLAFGSIKNTGKGSDLRIGEMEKFDPYFYSNDQLKPLVKAIMNHKELVRRYKAFYHELYSEYVKSDWIVDRIGALQNQIMEIRKSDSLSYYTFEKFEASSKKVTGKVSRIPGIETFVKNRRQYLKMVDFNRDVAPKVSDVEFKKRKGLSKAAVKDFTMYVRTERFPKRVHVYYMLEGNDTYKHMLLSDDGKGADKVNDDKKYSGTIKCNGANSMKYYIRTENIKMDRYFPANYTFEQYEISLDKLNK